VARAAGEHRSLASGSARRVTTSGVPEIACRARYAVVLAARDEPVARACGRAPTTYRACLPRTGGCFCEGLSAGYFWRNRFSRDPRCPSPQIAREIRVFGWLNALAWHDLTHGRAPEAIPVAQKPRTRSRPRRGARYPRLRSGPFRALRRGYAGRGARRGAGLGHASAICAIAAGRLDGARRMRRGAARRG